MEVFCKACLISQEEVFIFHTITLSQRFTKALRSPAKKKKKFNFCLTWKFSNVFCPEIATSLDTLDAYLDIHSYNTVPGPEVVTRAAEENQTASLTSQSQELVGMKGISQVPGVSIQKAPS